LRANDRANFHSAFSAFRFVSIREIRVKKLRAFANSATTARIPSWFEFIRDEESRNAGEKPVHGFMGGLRVSGSGMKSRCASAPAGSQTEPKGLFQNRVGDEVTRLIFKDFRDSSRRLLQF
jgi:hypothetical protein